jgi:hypothetical protein
LIINKYYHIYSVIFKNAENLKMTKFVITANRLNDGLVVFMSKGGCWANSILDAQVLMTDEDLKDHLTLACTSEQALIVVGPYEIEVFDNDLGDVHPLRYRERIRAYGPTTHSKFSRQDVPGHLTHLDDVSAVYFNEVD